MTLGILSDTHGYFHPALAEVLADVDLILHAGDVGRADILDQLEARAPTRALPPRGGRVGVGIIFESHGQPEELDHPGSKRHVLPAG